MDKKTKIKTFSDLKVWQEGHTLVLGVYRYAEKFPQFEKFALSNQMRRSAVSVTSNIAEGFGRQTKKEKNQFYYQAKGSLLELKSQLFIARDLKYLPNEISDTLIDSANYTHALLEGLIKTSFDRAK